MLLSNDTEQWLNAAAIELYDALLKITANAPERVRSEFEQPSEVDRRIVTRAAALAGLKIDKPAVALTNGRNRKRLSQGDPAMASKFSNEVDAIRKLRDAYPNMGQKTLATRIVGMTFTDNEHRRLAQVGGNYGGRPLLSVYSVIRRYDAKRKTTTTAAAA